MSNSDEMTIRAFQTFLDELLQVVRSAKVRTPPEKLREIVGGALVAKILRLSDAVLALCLGRHGGETGLLLRTLILAYANLTFVATHANSEGAALRFMSHVRHIRRQLEPHLVRPDAEGEAFPAQSPDAWAKDEEGLAERWDRIDAYVAENNITELVQERPADKNGKRPKPLEWSWTGLSERELFLAIDDLDAYRWYVWFSNEVHSNVVGIGDLVTQINAGRIDINDEVDFTRGPLALAGKYTVRALEAYDEMLGLGIASAIERASDRFSATLRESLGT